MFLNKDMKDYLLFTSNRVLDVLKISSRVLCMPSLLIYPTNICNYDCVMCNTGRGSIKRKERMDFTLLERILFEASKLLIKPEIHFSGYGEPLMYSRISEVMRTCKQRKLKWSMTTNGFLLDRYGEDIVKNSCYALNISIHGMASEHERITQTDKAFEKTISGIKKIEAERKKHSKASPLIAINCVISNNNVDYLKDILDMLLELPVSSIIFQHLAFEKKHLKTEEDFLILEGSKHEKIIQFMNYVNSSRFSAKVNFFPKIEKQDISGYYTDRDVSFRQSCVLPWLSSMIYPNGDVRQCDVVFGNLNDNSLKSVINSKAATAFRKKVKQGKFYSQLCFRCCHRHYY